MAAVATDTITISINDQDIQVPKGELIVEAVKRLGLEIPIFCYHQRLKPVGMCRMCIVEIGFKQPDGTVRKMPKPQAACTLPASEGMAVYTNTEMVHRDRHGVLEFLLINHPLDCPICDRGGECPLQNNTIFYGAGNTRYTEEKRHLPKAFPLSDYVTLDLERCIQCGRCVRFTEEISGDSQLAFRFRGALMQPSTFELKNFESKFSGNVIEICPVGALTNAKYRFRARPWDIETKASICTGCSNGCNIWFDYRVGKLVRVNARTNEDINEEWTCDKGKFGLEPSYNNETRLSSPFLRHGDKLVGCKWSEVIDPILENFSGGGVKVAALAGHEMSNESYFLLQKLFREGFGSNNLDSRYAATLPTRDQRISLKKGPHALDGLPVPFREVETKLPDLESKSTIVVFGTSLVDELPIVFLRVRKAWFQNGTNVIIASSEPTDADTFAKVILRYKSGTDSILANGLLAEMVRSGRAKVDKQVEDRLKSFDLKRVETETGIASNLISEAAILIDENSALILSRSIYNSENVQETVEALANFGSEFNLMATGANEQGALDWGVLPDTMPLGKKIESGGMNTLEILNACAAGKVKALWLAGVDPFEVGLDHALVESALENVEFLVVQGISESECLAYASVVLPMAAPAEESGSWTNCVGTVQAIDQVVPALGDARSAWRVFNELLLRLGKGTPRYQVSEITSLMAE